MLHAYLRGRESTAATPITGTDGDDVLTGGVDIDTIYGLAGNDLIDGGEGADLLYGGTGNDRYLVDRQDDIVFEDAASGQDSVIATSNFYLYANIEGLQLVGSGDFFGVGNQLDNTIIGNGGINLLIGGAGDDIVRGNAGNDQLFGEEGEDDLAGGDGIDYLVGGNANDYLDGGNGADALYGQDGSDILAGGLSFDTDIMVGGDGADLLFGDSGLGDYDLMDGGAGDDTYFVDTPADLTFEADGGGIDTVNANIVGAGYYLYAFTENLILEGITPFGVGNERDNQLTGNAIGNYLLGGIGNDTLNGKAGNDVLFGESGADTFIFERNTDGDVIGDFQPGVDKISLVGLGFSSYAQLQPNIFEVAGTTGINLGSGDLIVINGVTNAALSAGDFLFG